MTFQMNRAAASIYLLIKLHAAFFAETPAFHMFFKSVFHYHPASINESVWRYGTSLVRICKYFICGVELAFIRDLIFRLMKTTQLRIMRFGLSKRKAQSFWIVFLMVCSLEKVFINGKIRRRFH